MILVLGLELLAANRSVLWKPTGKKLRLRHIRQEIPRSDHARVCACKDDQIT